MSRAAPAPRDLSAATTAGHAVRMPRIGAHMSTAGGVSRAVERAALHGCETLQIFTRNANQWRGRPLEAAEIDRFRTLVAEHGLHPVVSHASYLINVASADPALRQQSMAALVDELARADALGLHGVVLHPGACTSGTEEDALALVAEAIDEVFAVHPPGTARLLLEHTAGQGRTSGYRFEHLAAILDRCRSPERLGVCLDTCHLLAAGYDLTTDDGFAATFEAFERTVGFERLFVVHVNDSKKPLGSRVDRHEHIGRGFVGEGGFLRLFADPRFERLPFLLETPKSKDIGKPNAIERDPLDEENLGVLRRLRAAAGVDVVPGAGAR
jgi:deoxyribonuclease-4